MLFNALVLCGVEIRGGTIPLNARNAIERTRKVHLRRHLGVKFTTSYLAMLLKIGMRPIEMLALQRLYVIKMRNMPKHRVAWNVGSKSQKNLKSKILSSGWVLDIRKWFEQWGVEDLF